MAREASAFDISTKPKPRGRPVSRSTISVTFSTVPCLANRARTASSVAVNGRFPTYSLVTEEYSRINGINRQVRPASWFVKPARVRGWLGGGAGGRVAANTNKPKGHDLARSVQVFRRRCCTLRLRSALHRRLCTVRPRRLQVRRRRQRNSGIGLTGCGHGVVEVQLTGLPCANAHGALARAPQRSCRTMRRVCERGLNGGAEIELTIAVRVGAGELEEGPRRRMQYV